MAAATCLWDFLPTGALQSIGDFLGCEALQLRCLSQAQLRRVDHSAIRNVTVKRFPPKAAPDQGGEQGEGGAFIPGLPVAQGAPPGAEGAAATAAASEGEGGGFSQASADSKAARVLQLPASAQPVVPREGSMLPFDQERDRCDAEAAFAGQLSRWPALTTLRLPCSTAGTKSTGTLDMARAQGFLYGHLPPRVIVDFDGDETAHYRGPYNGAFSTVWSSPPLQAPLVAFQLQGRYKDQGWGNRKGNVRLYLLRPRIAQGGGGDSPPPTCFHVKPTPPWDTHDPTRTVPPADCPPPFLYKVPCGPVPPADGGDPDTPVVAALLPCPDGSGVVASPAVYWTTVATLCLMPAAQHEWGTFCVRHRRQCAGAAAQPSEVEGEPTCPPPTDAFKAAADAFLEQSAPGDVLVLMADVGGGGGHELFLRNMQLMTEDARAAAVGL